MTIMFLSGMLDMGHRTAHAEAGRCAACDDAGHMLLDAMLVEGL